MKNHELYFAALMAGVLLVGCERETNHEVESLLQDYVREIVSEAGDAKFLFTDGSFDKLIEAESAARGGSLVCIAVQPHADARTGAELAALMTGEEDRFSAARGGANLLRNWQLYKPERLAACGVQLGFELQGKRQTAGIPPVSGVLARTSWASQTNEIVEAGIARTRVLAERLLDLYQTHGEDWPSKLKNKTTADHVHFMQWRLARLARSRAEIYERLGASERAAAELQMAEALDACNAVSVAMREGFTRTQDHLKCQMTTREGLQFALQRADFPLARRFAEPILADEPDNPDANFAVGMDALMKEDYALAEKSLSKCVEKKSAEPALWNNLAVLKYRQGRYDEALQDAKKAESLAPDSVEIQDTIRQIKAAWSRDE